MFVLKRLGYMIKFNVKQRKEDRQGLACVNNLGLLIFRKLLSTT